MATAAQIIAARLYAAGCRHAFGIPGGEVLALIDALTRTGIEFHLCKHENAGGFMAEGTHHATGAPALLVATVGPGVANLVNAVANAHQDRVAMIVLSGRVDPEDTATYTHQIFDHGAVLSPVAKASWTVADGAAAALIDKAVMLALADQPGPVHLDLPIKVAKSEQGENAIIRQTPALPTAPAPGRDLDTVRALLNSARRPVLLAGVDALNHGAGGDIAGLARDFSIPLITTYKGKGLMREDDPLCLGAAGLSPRADAILLPVVQGSDLVILAGYDPIEMRAGWKDPWPGDADVVEFAAAANTHYMHLAKYRFQCDTAAGIRALRDGTQPRQCWPADEVAAIKKALADAFPVDEDWGPAAIIATARAALPEDIVATVDTGAHRILLNQIWHCHGPRTLLQSTGLCTMGVALPLAIGHSIASGRKPVVAFTGDAGLEMVLGELASARDLKVPVIIVVFVDASLALIELKQRAMQLGNAGVDFDRSDFPAIARALGGAGVEAADRETLRAEIEAALKRDHFTLIACPVERRAYDGRF